MREKEEKRDEDGRKEKRREKGANELTASVKFEEEELRKLGKWEKNESTVFYVQIQYIKCDHPHHLLASKVCVCFNSYWEIEKYSIKFRDDEDEDEEKLTHTLSIVILTIKTGSVECFLFSLIYRSNE